MYTRDWTNYRRTYETYDYNEKHEWTRLTAIDLDDKSVSYGDVKSDPAGAYLEIPFTTYSDHSGGTVERSNCDVFLSRFESLPGVWELFGGYGTRGVLILYSLYESNDEIKEAIDGLDGYPVLDENNWSELESNLEYEAWDSWIKYDLPRELKEQGIEVPEDEDKLREMFDSIVREHDIEYIHEDAVCPSMHLEEVVKYWPK